jgi:hypothetical protein
MSTPLSKWCEKQVGRVRCHRDLLPNRGSSTPGPTTSIRPRRNRILSPKHEKCQHVDKRLRLTKTCDVLVFAPRVPTLDCCCRGFLTLRVNGLASHIHYHFLRRFISIEDRETKTNPYPCRHPSPFMNVCIRRHWTSVYDALPVSQQASVFFARNGSFPFAMI